MIKVEPPVIFACRVLIYLLMIYLIPVFNPTVFRSSPHPRSSLSEVSMYVHFLFRQLIHAPCHQLPQQQNSFYCGLFLLYYLELFLAEAPVSFIPFKLITKFSTYVSYLLNFQFSSKVPSAHNLFYLRNVWLYFSSLMWIGLHLPRLLLNVLLTTG